MLVFRPFLPSVTRPVPLFGGGKVIMGKCVNRCFEKSFFTRLLSTTRTTGPHCSFLLNVFPLLSKVPCWSEEDNRSSPASTQSIYRRSPPYPPPPQLFCFLLSAAFFFEWKIWGAREREDEAVSVSLKDNASLQAHRDSILVLSYLYVLRYVWGIFSIFVDICT